RFRVDATGYGVVRYFNSTGLELPARVRDTGEIRWGSARHAFVIDVLRNPIYAGAYVYGRREERRALIDGELHQRHVTWLQPDAWKVCIKGRHASYIGWDEYMENQKKLEANRSNHSKPRQRGAAREGEALLQGLVLCGRCGYRMSSYYRGNRSEAGYRCRSEPRHHGKGSDCWTVSASAIDRAVVERFLDAAAPSEIELSLAVAVEAERQASEVLRQWDLRLERARYDARHAEKRYKAVDPENRVVARTLEKEWNDKLTHVEQLENDMRQAKEQAHLELTDDDRQQIRQMAKDLPGVWAAPTTSSTERKNLLRLAIQEITLSPIELPKRATRIQILWHSGAVEELVVDRPQLFALHPSIVRAERPRLLAAAIERVSVLCSSGLTDREIADALNDAGMLSLGQRPWTNIAVERFRGRHDIKHPIDRQTQAHLQHRGSGEPDLMRGFAGRVSAWHYIMAPYADPLCHGGEWSRGAVVRTWGGMATPTA
ncbi:MAG: recombinase, partial [candidate division NC10 bacterium]|nr:recombinase [candidate division NC10 bacterium]